MGGLAGGWRRRPDAGQLRAPGRHGMAGPEVVRRRRPVPDGDAGFILRQRLRPHDRVRGADRRRGACTPLRPQRSLAALGRADKRVLRGFVRLRYRHAGRRRALAGAGSTDPGAATASRPDGGPGPLADAGADRLCRRVRPVPSAYSYRGPPGFAAVAWDGSRPGHPRDRGQCGHRDDRLVAAGRCRGRICGFRRPLCHRDRGGGRVKRSGRRRRLRGDRAGSGAERAAPGPGRVIPGLPPDLLPRPARPCGAGAVAWRPSPQLEPGAYPQNVASGRPCAGRARGFRPGGCADPDKHWPD